MPLSMTYYPHPSWRSRPAYRVTG